MKPATTRTWPTVFFLLFVHQESKNFQKIFSLQIQAMDSPTAIQCDSYVSDNKVHLFLTVLHLSHGIILREREEAFKHPSSHDKF